MKIEPMTTEIMQTLLQNCPTGVLAMDHQRRVLWTNPALDNLLGIHPDTLAGRSAERVEREDLQVLFSDAAHLTVVGVDGEPRHLFRTRVAGESGDRVAELHYFSDQTDRVRLEDELVRTRQHADSLRLVEPDTGLMSRRALMLVLEPQVARCRRYASPLAAVVLNTEFATDVEARTAAREVSQLLKDQLRWADLVGRDDNGDFLIVLPETDYPSALAIADKLAQALQQNTHVTHARFGVVEWVKSDHATGLLQRARKTMLDGETSSKRTQSAR